MERLSLPSLGLFKRLARHGHRPAIVTPEATATYRSLLVASSHLARVLGRSSASSERAGAGAATAPFRPIALIAPRDHTYTVGQLAIFQAGGAYVPLHTKLPPAEARYILEDSGCRQAVVHPRFLRPGLVGDLKALGVEVVELPPGAGVGGGDGKVEVGFEEEEEEEGGAVGPGTDAMVVYTSGTTGRPKGVVKTHAQVEAMVTSLVEAWEYAETDRILHLLPLHHLHGIVNKCLCVLWAGGVVEFPSEDEGGGKKRRAAEQILRRLACQERERLTLFMGVPTIYAMLMEEIESADDGALDRATKAAAVQHFQQLRLMVSGSAALPQTLFRKWEELTRHRLLERYGTTEAGFIFSNPYPGPRLPGHVGQQLPGVETRLVDPATERAVGAGMEGEVRVRGPQVFGRYHGRPEATREAFDAEGWFRTGDWAVYDPEAGAHRILGRMSADIIKSGGYKISALEIEGAIQEALPRVAEAAVVGRPHAKWGEEIVAVVRLAEGSERLTLPELQAAVAARLAPYKVPRDVVVVDALPKNAMGKVNKKTLFQKMADLGLVAAPAAVQ